MIAGCYTLDLYCERREGLSYEEDRKLHEHNEFPHQFSHELGSACRAAARKKGWILNLKEGTAICPRCAKKEKGETK